MKKPLPVLRTDEEAEDFVANADLSEYDLSGGVLTRYEFVEQPGNLSVTLPPTLFEAVKAAAVRQGVPYQDFVRRTLEEAVAGLPAQPVR